MNEQQNEITFFKIFFQTKHQFPSHTIISEEQRKKLRDSWRRMILATYFLGIMRQFEKRIRIFGAIRHQEHMNEIQVQSNETGVIVRKFFIIYPQDKFKTFWNLWLVFLHLLTAVIVPFRVCFTDDVNWDVWYFSDIIFDFLYFIDVIVNFLSAYEDDKKNVIDNPKMIAYEYATGWFIVDVSSIIPISYFMNDDGSTQSKSYNKLLKLLRLPRLYRQKQKQKNYLIVFSRLLRLLKLQKDVINIKNKTVFARTLSNLGIGEGVLKAMILLGKILLVNHIVACFWYFLARINDFDNRTWVNHVGFSADYSLFQKYIGAYQWSLQTLTTVGYGNIYPFSIEEKIFAIFWMIFGAGFFSYTLGKLSSIIEYVDKNQTEFDKRMHLFNDFAARVQLPYPIKSKVHKYYKNNHLRNVYTSLDPKRMIQELPSQIRNELLLICYQFLKDSNQILQVDDNFTATLLPYLNFCELMPGEIIYRQDDPPTDIYFIYKGKVIFQTNDKYNMITLSEGAFFGELEAFHGKNREYYAIASDLTELYFCSSEIFIELLKEFPNVAEQVVEKVNRRKQKYQICNQMIELQRLKNSYIIKKGHDNTTQHYLNLISSYENEKFKQSKVKGAVVLQNFQEVEQPKKNKRINRVVPLKQ